MKKSILPGLDGTYIFASSKVSDGIMDSKHTDQRIAFSNKLAFLDQCKIRTKPHDILSTHSCNVIVNTSGETRELFYEPIVAVDLPKYSTGFDAFVGRMDVSSATMLSADCLPLLLIDEGAGIFGLAHVGMLGAINNLARNVVLAMVSQGSEASTLKAYFGPAIPQGTYNIEKSGLWEAIRDQSLVKKSDIHQFIEFERGQTLFDLRAMVAKQLSQCGLPFVKVEKHSVPTDGINYFSHYLHRHFGMPKGNFLTVFGVSSARTWPERS